MCDYFSAVDDRTAAAVVERPGGPAESGFDVVHLKNIDPVVAIAQLEAVLTNCTYEEAGRRPRAGQLLSSPQVEGPFVFSLSDTLVEALARATRADFVRAAERWSATAEPAQWRLDERAALGVLEALADLAGRARAGGLGVYCWWAL